jgi:hypothetical protein
MSIEIKEQTVGEGTSQSDADSGASGGTAGDNPGGTPAADAKEGDTPPAESDAGEVDGEKPAEPPKFVAKSKFKVRQFDAAKADELIQQEIDVPARFKELMKDAESEKEVLEVLEKAFGIEAIKGERAHVKKELGETRVQLKTMQDGVQELRTIYQRGDINMFLQKLAIPRERMLQWALDEVTYTQLPPEQQRVHDERILAQRQAYEAEKRASMTQNQSSEQIRQATSLLLDAGLARPDNKSFADLYDSQVGKPGSFRDEVIATGNSAWNESNGQVVLTPEQAIERTLAKWKPFLSKAQATPATQAPANPAAQSAQPGTQPAVAHKPGSTLPNLQGRSQSPVKSSAPRSIEDLKKLRSQMQG